MSLKTYRADIDGLRAVAVISVLLYHLGVAGFSGGFVGVDVFFVISGFLITRLILNEMKEERFSFVEFYGRRARRLFPAFFFMVVMSFIAAYFLFTPEHMARFSGAVVYALGSISNFYFWGESGYFDASSNLKPLLHTWTLGVEEQFYFIWPIILLLMVKKTKPWIAPAFMLIAGAVSLFYAEWFLISDPEAVFYLVPFRVFEFAVGGILVWFIHVQTRNKIVLEVVPAIGLGMIIYSIYAYSDDTLFPGLSALLPGIGAALIIYSTKSKIIGGILGNKLFVKVGLISYSLYLAHWPVIVFYKYYKFDASNSLTGFEIISLIVVMFVIAILMYVFIETPFRKKVIRGKLVSAPAYGFICVVCSMLFIIPAASAWSNEGWVWRYTNLSETTRNELVSFDGKFRDYAYKKIIELHKLPYENNKKKKVLVVGDSQAGDFINMLYENNYHTLINLSSIILGAKCQPLLPSSVDLNIYIGDKYKATCESQRKKYASSNKLEEADVVILTAAWRNWGVKHLSNTINQLRQRGIKEIYVIGSKTQGESGQTLLARFMKVQGIEAFSASRQSNKIQHINMKLKENIASYAFIDIYKFICTSSNHCLVLSPGGKVIFYDKSHVTPDGAKYLGGILKNAGELKFLSEI
jgi:peptidoglycan/LPS O-acetylase OafA/YrhL